MPSFSRFVLNHVCSVFRLLCSCVVAVGMPLWVDVILKSPAYAIMLTLAGLGAVS